jgi:ABC-type dipeptide/oligopeptide/nickel transport system permease component
MRHMVLRRLGTLPFVLAGVAVILFIISQVLPSDPARLIGGDGATPEMRAQISKNLGLDRPPWEQFVSFVDRLIHGDLGVSIRYHVPVSSLIMDGLPATLTLVATATLVAIIIALTIGVLSARYRGTWFDVVSRAIVVIGTSTPVFFIGLVAILIFGYYFDLLPVSGRGDPPDVVHLILPSLVLGLHEAGSATRILRASMIDELNSDQAQAARARGVPRGTILIQNGARNAVLPTITDLGVGLADLAGSVILIETVFNWPGIGKLVATAIQWNDFPLISGAVLMLVLYSVLVSLLVDILYGVFDPRLR